MNRSLLTVLLVLAGVFGAAVVPAFGQYETAVPQPRRDVGKYAVESPTKDILARAAAAPENPAVQPGLVKWHPTFEAACKAANESTKPVLLFHLLGRLDQEFC